MPRYRQPEPVGPDWPPEKTLRALNTQLERLQKLKGRHHREAQQEEREWQLLTSSILTHGFGKGSDNKHRFGMACNAGSYRVGGVPEGIMQSNFAKRTQSTESVVRASIDELKLIIPEEEPQGSYEPGEQYEFYRDLKGIVVLAQRSCL